MRERGKGARLPDGSTIQPEATDDPVEKALTGLKSRRLVRRSLRSPKNQPDHLPAKSEP
jgi:hypothetical protein